MSEDTLHDDGGARRRGRFYFTFFILVAGFGILGAAGIKFVGYLNESPRFLVQRIQVDGAYAVTGDEIQAAAGITTKDNLMALDTDAVAARVAKIPYVKTCIVERSYPDTAIIRIEERVPAVALSSENHVYELDPEAMVLREAQPAEVLDLPLVTNVPDLGIIEMGQKLEHPAILAAMKIWQAFAATTLAEQHPLSEMAARAEDNIVMYLQGVPFEIRWGPGDPRVQAQYLDILWKDQQGKLPCKEYLEVRFDEDLVCK